MAKSLNKVMLIGNVGKDPEMRYTNSGKAVASFSLATNEKRGETEQVEWHNIVAWEKLAEIIQQYVKKGSRLYIEGRIQTRSWDDTTTGTKKYMTEVVANQMLMLDAKQPTAEAEGPKPEDLF